MSNKTPHVIAFRKSDFAIVPLRKIPQETLEEFNKIHTLLNNFYRALDLVPILRSNYIEFEQTLKRIPQNFEPKNISREESLNKLYLVNRVAINFLNAFRLYLDHTETRLKRNYGPSSSVLKIFKEKTSEIYDNTKEYAFVYQLRNYVQHLAKPISISGNANFREGEVEPHKSDSIVHIDKESLLKNYDEWKDIVRDKLEKYPDKIDPIPLFKTTLDHMQQIDQAVRSKEKELLKTEGEKLLNAFEDEIIKGYNFAVGLASFDDGEMDAELTKFPYGALLNLGFEFEHINRQTS